MEEVIEIINDAKILSIKALNQFYINLGIDPNHIKPIFTQEFIILWCSTNSNR